MEKTSAGDLKLKKDDDGFFYLLLKAAEKASNSDQESKFHFMTARIVENLVNSKHEKAMERAVLVVREEEASFQKEIDGFKLDNLCFKIPKKARSTRIEEEEKIVRSCNEGMGGSFDLLLKAAEQAMEEEDIDIDGSRFDHHSFKNPKRSRSRTNNSLKRLSFLEEDDNDYEKKEKMVSLEEDDNDYEKKEKMVSKPPKKKQRNSYRLLVSDPVPDLPLELRNQIEGMKGGDIVMVMQKRLTNTDLKTHQNRLSIPRGKIRNEFLTEEDKNTLEEKDGRGEGINVTMIEPCLDTTNLVLTRWHMGGESYYSYALIKNWSSISQNQRNQLEENAMVQLWSFRVGLNLWFALVKV